MRVRANIVLLDENGRHERGDEFTTTKAQGVAWRDAGKVTEVAAPSKGEGRPTRKRSQRPRRTKPVAVAAPAPVSTPIALETPAEAPSTT